MIDGLTTLNFFQKIVLYTCSEVLSGTKYASYLFKAYLNTFTKIDILDTICLLHVNVCLTIKCHYKIADTVRGLAQMHGLGILSASHDGLVIFHFFWEVLAR